MLRVVGSVLVAALLAPGTAWGKGSIGTAGRDTIVGTAAADFVKPRPGADTVAARGGNDRIASPADGAVDRIGCGEGLDLALVELLDRVASDCETLARQLSRDRTSDFLAQHETQVEPHSLAVGRTIVAAFQSGRFQAGGGAAAIGWAASADAGRTWRSGTLPTQFPAVSDPVVAYDAAHTTWLIAYVAVTGTSVDVYVSRSRDGRVWQAPIAVAVAPSPSADYDKEWIVCDNGVASRFRGRCYVSYLDTGSTTIVTRSSTDGGRTWGAPVGSRAGVVDGSFVNGALPIVRPNGDLLVLHTVFAPFGGAGGDWVASVRSPDGGATFAPAARVASLEAEDVLGMRAPPLVTAAVDARGTVRVVWADCRFQEDCRSNDLALTTSSNGTTWTPPQLVPATVSPRRTDAMIPAVAVDGTNVALAYYTLPQPDGCAQAACPGPDAWLVTQRAGVWSVPRRLSPQAMPLGWLADTGLGAMVGDYTSVSWVAGKPLAVVAIATEPENGTLREAIFAAGPA